MIENFLRPPRRVAEVAADVLRAAGLLSVFVAAGFFDLTDAGVIAFVLPGLVAPRFLGMRAWADLAVSGILLIAAWSNVFDLYSKIPWWDLAVHFACTGVVAAGCYLLLAQRQLVPDPRRSAAAGIIMTTALGLALSAVWEMIEWLARAYINSEIFTTYNDTIGDMALGGLGALGAGFAVAFLPLLPTRSPTLAELPLPPS